MHDGPRNGALLLARSDIARLATPRDYLDVVREAFRSFALGEVQSPPPMEIHVDGGAFHAKGAAMTVGGRRLAVLKLNGNFPLNPQRGLPTIQGAVLLCDADNGVLLAILDSGEITLRRTAAASAVATDLLARPDAATLLICGCGAQGRAHAEAIAPLRRFERAFVHDADHDRARAFAEEMSKSAGLAFAAAEALQDAAREADVIVTTTTAKSPILHAGDVKHGAFIAAVGADNPFKSEIAADLVRDSVIITDVTDQCAVMGDLRAALQVKAVTRDAVRAQLGEVVAGQTPGRRNNDEIIIFDSTGAAFQDVASAAMIYERALAAGVAARIALGA